MPPAKRATTSSKPASASKPAAKKPAATKTPAKTAGSKAATSGTKATATTARKSAARTTTQAKGAATRTANAAKAGVKETAAAAKTGAKGTATVAKGGVKATATQAKAANTRTKNASGGAGIVATAADAARPNQPVTLTREKIQETLDGAAARGRGAKGLQKASKRVRKAEPVDRIVRGADRARRAAGVGPSFPIMGYDDLTAPQVQARVKELTKPEARKVLTYERKNANRKGVVTAIEKQLA